jgi:hypothetical protein
MHCCQPGSAMIGVRDDQNVWKCITLDSVMGEPFLDMGTQRFDMHACPLGSVMLGMHAAFNYLACEFPGTPVSSEFVDGNPATQDEFPMHVCSAGVMTGVRLDRNEFTCGM